MQMTRMLKRIGAVVLAVALTACGGGGSDAGCSVFSTSCTTGTGTGATTTTTAGTGTVALSLSADSVSASAPVTVTALVKNAAGEVVAGTVVNFTVANGGATPVPQRVVTDAKGVAATVLQVSPGGSGADYVVANADITTTQTATARAAITVVANPNASSSSGSVALSIGNTTISASSPGTVTAQVKNAAGEVVAGTVVNFTVTNGGAVPVPQRVVTDAKGMATTVLQVSPSGGGADYVVASADITTTQTATARAAITVVADPNASSSSGSVALSMGNTTISASSPGTVTALVKKADGKPLANVMVTFAVVNGSATVSPLRVSTDAQGIATTTLKPVSGASGADYVTATADVSSTEGVTARTVFTVSPSSLSSSSGVAGSVVLNLSNNTISASSPGTVVAQVKSADGALLANTLVTFSVANGTALVSPPRVLTDDKGNASATLTPVAGAIGGDYVLAVADLSATASLSTRTTFTVSAVNVALASVAASPAGIDAYGASVIAVNVTGASSASPVTVNFSSTCAAAGKAVLSPASVTVTGSTASTTYQDKACAGTDRISVGITGTSQQKQVDLAVAVPVAQALEFVSASPDKICLAGSGCEVSSVVSFRLKDQYNNPVAGREVSFSLDIPNVAILSPTTYKTNDSGIAQVSVTAKTIPSPVRVRADVTLDNGAKLSTVSNVLAINAGLPTQRAFSFSAAAYNPDGWSRDGTESEIRVQLTDRFANPVPDATSISFVAEGASIIPARCTTVNGICTVKFVTSNFRPTNGRVTVVAFAQGEESFNDADGDNKYTAGEVFTDLGQVFIDKDEDGQMAAAGEYHIGEAANGVWGGNTLVRISRVFTLSDSSRAPRLFSVNGDGTCSNTALPYQVLSMTQNNACRLSTRFCMRDANTAADALGGNPVPANATLTLATKAKGGSVSVDASPVTGTWTSPTTHTVTADLDDCTKPLEASGPIDLTVKMPNGQSYKFDIGRLE